MMQTLSYVDNTATKAGETVLQGTYRLGQPIGRGAMGVVYEASHARLPGRFAIKFLLPELATSTEAFARFCREAEIMSELRHPNVVQIFDFNMTPDGLPYFVMDLLEGCDLEERLRSGGKMPLTKVVAIVEQIASALNAAHRRGIIHRDLKPSNVFLLDIDGQDDQVVKVLDFGVSKLSSGSRLTGESEVIGTPHYMAPEQALANADQIDAQSDQFSLAAIAYEMLTGKEAFIGDDASTLLYQIIHERPQPLSMHLHWNTIGLQKVLNRALAKDPAMRYDSITHFARAFEQAADRTLCPPSTTAARSSVAPPAAVLMAAPSAASVAARSESYQEPACELPSSIDRIPISPYRALWLAAVAVALMAVIVVEGWTRELPSDVAFAYRGAAAWIHPRPPAPQRAVLPAPPPGAGEPIAPTSLSPSTTTPPSSSSAAPPLPAPLPSLAPPEPSP